MHGESGLENIDEKKATERIIEFLQKKIDEAQVDGLVLGLSGGIDSSTAAYICAQSLTKEKILGLIMPSETTSSEDVLHAQKVAEDLGIEYEIIHIDPLIKLFPTMCPHEANKLAAANLKARSRMMILYYHANSLNRLVVGTGNRTELLIGYFTKYGDGGVDILPLGDLYKAHVRKIASYVGVPDEIIEKAPSAGLWSGQTDEEELGIKYDILDQLLNLLIDQKLSEEQVSEALNLPLNEVIRVKKMIKQNEHKLLLPEIPLLR